MVCVCVCVQMHDVVLNIFNVIQEHSVTPQHYTFRTGYNCLHIWTETFMA